MDTTGRIVGQFGPPPFPIPGVLQFDGFSFAAYGVAWTNGWTLAQSISPPPQRGDAWTLLGISVNLRYGLSIPGTSSNGKRWGVLGKLLAGVSINSDLASNPIATTLPADMSNFGTIFDGATDSLRIVPDYTAGVLASEIPLYSLIQQTFMFPQPITIGWETPVEVGLIQTPSLTGASPVAGGTFIRPVVLSGATYTLIYDQTQRGKGGKWY